MIRVLHSVSNMDRAGIETMLMNYYRHIDRSKVQFDFLCNKKKPGAYDDEIKSMGGKIYRTPGLNPIKYPMYVKYMFNLFDSHPEYKILHAHNGAFAVYSLFTAMLKKVPVRIFHGHSAAMTFDLKWPLKRFCKLFLNFTHQYNFACGEAAAGFYYSKKTINLGNYRVIHNAIEVERFVFNDGIREELREKYNLKNKFVVGHVGRFCSQKNHKFLIKIFAEIKKKKTESVLVLLGEGELMDSVKKQVSELGLTDSVIFVGNVNNANEWYQAFDCFVLPSVWEGLPVVGIEAQAAGLPSFFSMAVTDEVGITDKAEFVSLNERPEIWADKILNAFKLNVRENMKEKITIAGYNIEEEARKLQQFYENKIKELK